ncbi:hypothetical protein Tco_0413711 [Tanacetum coccineum]
MAQQIILVDQLVPKFQGIGRCNNYNVLHSIPRSLEWKIIGKILLGHPLSYALTATADVPAITYKVDMFRDTLKLPVETPDTLFITPVTIETIESFMQTFGYQGVLDKEEECYSDPRFINLIIADLMEKYPSIPHDEDYHSIKDDTLLVSVYSIGNDLFRGMRIPDAFLTSQIRATNDYKEYETVFDGVYILMNQPQPVDSTNSPRKSLKVTIRQKKKNTPSIPPPSDDREWDKVAEATILSLTLHKTALATEAQGNYCYKVEEKLMREELRRMLKIEPGSYKEHPKNVNDDDEEIEKQKKDDEIENKKKDDDVE